MINITIITTVASSHSTPHLDLALDIFSFQIFSWVPIFTALVLIACIFNYSPENTHNLEIIFENLRLSEARAPYKHMLIGVLKMTNLLSRLGRF